MVDASLRTGSYRSIGVVRLTESDMVGVSGLFMEGVSISRVRTQASSSNLASNNLYSIKAQVEKKGVVTRSTRS